MYMLKWTLYVYISAHMAVRNVPWIDYFPVHFARTQVHTLHSSAAVSIDMNGRVCGALVQLGCYQPEDKYNVM